MWIRPKAPQPPSGTPAKQPWIDGAGRPTVARWLVKDDQGVPPELLTFSPDDWVFGASNNPVRLQMALDRWYEGRWEWIIADPNRRTIDGLDCIDILFERRENKASAARF
jgi:hypothetical protein